MSRLTELYKLVASLDPGEKRFISRYQMVQYDGNSQAKALLGFLLDCEPENGLPPELPSGLKSLEKNLPTVVARLRASLLSLLRMQHGGKTAESRIHLALEEIRILFEKNLWEEAGRTIRWAQKTALQYSRQPLYLRLLEWERIMVQSTLPADSRARYMDIREREKKAEAQLILQSNLRHLECLIRDMGRKRLHLKTREEREEIGQILRQTDIESGLQSSDFLSFVLASTIQGTCYLFVGEMDAAQERLVHLYENWVSRPRWIQEQPNRFIDLLHVLIVTLLNSNNGLPVFNQVIEFVNALEFPDLATRLALKKATFQSSMLVYMNTARIDEGVRLADKIGAWLEQNEDFLTANTRLMFLYNSAVVYFLKEKYHLARGCIHKILSQPVRTARTEIREFARLFQLVLNHELGDLDLNEFQIPAAYQYFQRHGISPLQSKTLAMLQSLGNSRSKKEVAVILKNYAEELGSMQSDVGKMELLIWAQARSRGYSLERSYRNIVNAPARP